MTNFGIRAYMDLLRSFYHYLLAWVGDKIYQHPSGKVFVVGVTGTKGKSTVVELINFILESAGKKTAISSSVRFKVNGFSRPNLTGMSMPGRFFIQQFLREAVKKECQYAIIEVTSQGILQHRHCFIDFDAAVFTNLEPEHIEAHGSFENYRNSKVRFFRDAAEQSGKRMKYFFINTDARDKEYFIDAAKGHGEIVIYDKKDIMKIRMKTKLIGEFNLENIAAAVSVARSIGIEWDVIREAVELFNGVPGRLEFIQKIPFSVIIDYAHTPDSLEKVYHTVKKSVVKKSGPNKLICVLGSAGGGRDMWKRAVMGEIAAKYCDHIILTNEDPFDEDPGEILNHVEAGILNDHKKKVKKIIDRKEAIRAAVKMARKGDAVIITGKGSEPYMRVAGGKKIAWNEKEIVTKILNHETIEI